ncbi:MAG: acyltransferase family protein, partial [Clostridia bacterium]|nr:acyltransferase family protein [Clostridia bacterium]
MEKKQKSAYITLLSVIGSIAVVLLHSNGCFWNFSAEARYWKTANVIECVFYFAVPVFFMISGATLLDYRERYDTAAFLKKRALKTVVPFLFWSLFGVVW